MAKLTQRTAAAAQPRARPYELRDGTVRGLLLRVQPSGVKSFIVQWARGKRRTLGRFPVISAEAARTQALAVLADASKHDGTPEVAKTRARVLTLGAFIEKEYGPWVVENRKDGAATVARLTSTFGAWHNRALLDVTPWIVEKWRSKRRKRGIAAATVNRDLGALKACLSRAVEWGFIESNPLVAVKPSKVDTRGRVRYLSEEEEHALRTVLRERDAAARAGRARANAWRKERGYALLPAIPARGYADHLTPLVLLAINTGLRRGELTSLTWADVDLQRKALTVAGSNAKSGKTRHVPLNKEAVDVLTRWQRQVPAGRLFDVVSVRKAFNAVLAEAGITGFRFHDLRHTFASKLVMAGADLYVVRDLLGHASIAMTERYAHLAPGRTAAAVALLEEAG